MHSPRLIDRHGFHVDDANPTRIIREALGLVKIVQIDVVAADEIWAAHANNIDTCVKTKYHHKT